MKFPFFILFVLLQSCIQFVNNKNMGIHETWVISWGSSQNDVPGDITLDSFQNIYVAGVTYGNIACKNKGEADIFLCKTDSSGKQLWIKQWGTKHRENVNGVTVGKQGFIYVAGSTNGNLDLNKNAGGYDIFLTKLDTAGNVKWTFQWGTQWDDCINAIDIDTNGNIFLAGYSTANITNRKNNQSENNAQICLLKINDTGKIIWKKQWGTKAPESATSIKISKSRNIYICGWTQGELEKKHQIEFDDIFISKLDSNGNVIWTRQWGTDNNDEAYSLCLDADENVYITGRLGEPRTNVRLRHDDAFICKYDSSGNKIWSKKLGTPNDDVGKNIVCQANKIFIYGSTYGKMKNCRKNGYADVFLLTLSPKGKILLSKQWGTGQFTYSGACEIKQSKIYLCGDISAELNGNPTKFNRRKVFLSKWKILY